MIGTNKINQILTRSARLNFDTTQKERIRKFASMRSV